MGIFLIKLDKNVAYKLKCPKIHFLKGECILKWLS